MPHTPSERRETRSNSAPSTSLTLNDIKSLIEKSKEEILGSFKKELNGITELLTTLVKRVDELDRKCDQLQNRCSMLEANEGKLFSSVMEEMELRTQRRNNIIVSGIQLKKDGSLEERKEDDTDRCTAILEEVGVSSDDISEIRRIGGQGKASRALIKVKLVSYDAKQAAIRNSKQLRTNHPNVYINPDRTPTQQLLFKQLRNELKSRRENGEDVIIQKGHVVPRGTRQMNFQYRF